MSDFKGEDYDFAAGSIHGMRSWGMDTLGRLHGVTHAEVWRPGENVSVCKATKRVPCPNREALDKRPVRRGELDRYDIYRFDVLRSYVGGSCNDPECRDWTHPEPIAHTFDPNCDCGFWAYDEHTFKSHGDVSGVIEGYGRTTIGTRGFRCEKAKIVALCREHNDELLSLSSWLRLQQLYPDAAFFEDRDEMVTRFGGVLRNWEQVGEDFWDKPVSRPRDTSWSSLSALSSLYAPPMRWAAGGVV